MTTRDQALTIAVEARTAEEIERAMMLLAALPDDPEVDAVRTDLSARLDAATAGLVPPVSHETSRFIDVTYGGGADNQ